MKDVLWYSLTDSKENRKTPKKEIKKSKDIKKGVLWKQKQIGIL